MKHNSIPKHLKLIREDISRVAADVGKALHRLSGKTLLLTGANGYLASYMAETVAWLNENVFSSPCFLIALTRSRVTLESRLGHLRARKEVKFIVQDISSPIHLNRHVDFIVHAASNASPHKYLAHPLDTMNANVIGTQLLLEMAKKEKVESMLFFSSGEIYGEIDPKFAPVSESYSGHVDCMNPRACYTESKRYGETLCVTYGREYKVPIKIVRPFHIYGPGLSLGDGRVAADFLKNKLENKPIQVLSDGRGIRSFCYISDATTGFWKALFSGCDLEAFNIGDDSEHLSVRQLASLVAGLKKPKVPVVFNSRVPVYSQGSPSKSYPNIGKARKLLKFSPRVKLQEGLLRTFSWYQLRYGSDYESI